jgi:hypothetical protein
MNLEGGSKKRQSVHNEELHSLKRLAKSYTDDQIKYDVAGHVAWMRNMKKCI